MDICFQCTNCHDCYTWNIHEENRSRQTFIGFYTQQACTNIDYIPELVDCENPKEVFWDFFYESISKEM